MALEAVNQYMVELGFRYDPVTLASTLRNFKVFERKVEGGTNKLSINWGNMAKAISSAVIAVTDYVLTMGEAVAKSNIEMQKLSRRWQMSIADTRALSTSLESLGYDFEDIATMTEDEFNAVSTLRKELVSLEPPEAITDAVDLFSQLSFALGFIEAELKYFKQYLFGSLSINSDGSLQALIDKTYGFFKYLKENIPNIASKLGDVLAPVIKIVNSVLDLIPLLNELGLTTLLEAIGNSLKSALNIVNAIIRVITMVVKYISNSRLGSWIKGVTQLFGELAGKFSGRTELLDDFLNVDDYANTVNAANSYVNNNQSSSNITTNNNNRVNNNIYVNNPSTEFAKEITSGKFDFEGNV